MWSKKNSSGKIGINSRWSCPNSVVHVCLWRIQRNFTLGPTFSVFHSGKLMIGLFSSLNSRFDRSFLSNREYRLLSSSITNFSLKKTDDVGPNAKFSWIRHKLLCTTELRHVARVYAPIFKCSSAVVWLALFFFKFQCLRLWRFLRKQQRFWPKLPCKKIAYFKLNFYFYFPYFIVRT